MFSYGEFKAEDQVIIKATVECPHFKALISKEQVMALRQLGVLSFL